MTQSSTLYVGMDVHKDSIAVAYVAKDAQEVRGGRRTPRHTGLIDDAAWTDHLRVLWSRQDMGDVCNRNVRARHFRLRMVCETIGGNRRCWFHRSPALLTVCGL